MPRALVTGITGQDGWYLTELLSNDGFDVYGLVTPGDPARVPPPATVVTGDLADGDSLARAVALAAPDEVYNLAGLSSVAESWSLPERVADINGVGVVRLLHALAAATRESAPNGGGVRFVQASSAEIFAGSPPPHDERSTVSPTTPYGAAKAFAHHCVGVYRSTGVGASSAILYNHESPRRPEHFVTRKISRAVARIACGSTDQLVLGNLDARRDWGHARDYMRALTLMARHRDPSDFVVASGVSHSVEDFVAEAFACIGVSDWQRHVRVDDTLARPSDAAEQRGNPAKAREVLGWQPEVSFEELVGEMVAADVAALQGSPQDFPRKP
ncbi:MAG: GDP-mannose 4,6-dehydratase [Actinomycetota bacterium]|nr:GDP-mannose 4,6-dehydratase [Actinomycetota bacterium]